MFLHPFVFEAQSQVYHKHTLLDTYILFYDF